MDEILGDLIPELGNHVRCVETNIEASHNTFSRCAIHALATLILSKNAGIMASQFGNSAKRKNLCWILDRPGP